MIAEVYPVKRLPRKFDVFDYRVPAGMQIARGDFVRVPFRSGEAAAVVARVKNVPETRALKDLLGQLDAATLTESEIAFFEQIAKELVQSVSSVLFAALPTQPFLAGKTDPATDSPRPRADVTLPTSETEALRETVRFVRERASSFACVPGVRRAAAVIQGYQGQGSSQETTLVLAPNVRDAQMLAAHLGAGLVTGEEPQVQRRRAWHAWRSGTRPTLVCTRTGVMLPHPGLSAIFIARSGHENHKQSNRNPRLDARAAACMRASTQNARLCLLDVAPRPDELLNAPEAIDAFPHPSVVIADLRAQRSISPHPVLSSSFCEAAESTLASGQSVLCLYNRRGVSRRLRCRDCGHVFLCTCGTPFSVLVDRLLCYRCSREQPTPIDCPACHGHDLLPRGFAIQSVASALSKQFSNKSVAILEKDTPAPPRADILLVTRHYLENMFDPFRPPSFGLVAELDADLPLFQPHFRAAERAIISALETRGMAHAARAKFLLQTESPQFFQAALDHPLAFFREELKNRRDYDQPPHVRHMTVARRVNGESVVERFTAAHPPADFRALPDSVIIDTWADS